MVDAPGAGLAAPQIGVGLRVFTYYVDGSSATWSTQTSTCPRTQQEGEEGCLSFPGICFETPRALRVVAKGFDQHGEPVTIEGSDLLARCIQHETDHLDGILFIDRMDRAAAQAGDEGDPRGRVGRRAAPTVKVSPHSTFGRRM